MNLQCVLVPTAPTTRVATTTTTAASTTTTVAPTPRASSDPALEGLLKALELCNNLGGFVPYHLLTRAQVTAGKSLR